MKWNYIFVAVVFILILLTGCASRVAGGPNSAEKLSDEFPPTMSGAVIVEAKTYKINEGNSKWERKQGLETEVAMTDAASPAQLAETVDAIKAEPNTTIQIEIEQDPHLSVYLWHETNRVEDEEKLVPLKSNLKRYFNDNTSTLIVMKEYKRCAEFQEACINQLCMGVCHGLPDVGTTFSSRYYSNWDYLEKQVSYRLSDMIGVHANNKIFDCHKIFYTARYSLVIGIKQPEKLSPQYRGQQLFYAKQHLKLEVTKGRSGGNKFRRHGSLAGNGLGYQRQIQNEKQHIGRVVEIDWDEEMNSFASTR